MKLVFTKLTLPYVVLFLTSPFAIFSILSSKKIHKSYKMNAFKKLKLGLKMVLNNIRIESGTAYNVHLAMALKILEIPPDVKGAIMECGTWKGGSAANLSLVCKIVGRKLIIYDSFEGLPEAKPDDLQYKYAVKGNHKETLEEVKNNLRKYGEIESCEFVKGWFHETLPKLKTPILLAFLDVDLQDSLNTCVKYIWPNLTEEGFIFIDECQSTDYCALFYSEKWWRKNFNTIPPGLIGAGTGIPLGSYYIGPYSELSDHPLQKPYAGAYTQKNMTGYWDYYPEENKS